jgi:hypothetical protein
MAALDAIDKIWPAFAACLGFIIWMVRLEGKVNHAEQSIRELTVKHESLDSELVKKLASLETSIARIEGYLKAKNEGA